MSDLELYAKSLNARVKVENELWQVAIGAAELPTPREVQGMGTEARHT